MSASLGRCAYTSDLQQRDPHSFGLLLVGLNAELQAALTGIRQQGVQLIEAHASRTVAAQGGYNFEACAVPASFNFGQG